MSEPAACHPRCLSHRCARRLWVVTCPLGAVPAAPWLLWPSLRELPWPGRCSQEARAPRSTGVCVREARVAWDSEEQRVLGGGGPVGVGVGVGVGVFVGVGFGFDFEVGVGWEDQVGDRDIVSSLSAGWWQSPASCVCGVVSVWPWWDIGEDSSLTSS